MASEPIASGNLEKTPFPHLLVYLEQRALSGTLAVWPDRSDGAEPSDKGQDRILMLKGKPVGARLMAPATDLQAGLLRIFARRNAPYAFYEGNLLGSTEGRLSGRLDPLALIAEALRGDDVPDEVVAGVLGRLGKARLGLTGATVVERLGLTPTEDSMIAALKRQPATIAELVAAGSAPQMRALRTVYLLVVSKAVSPVKTAAVDGPSPAGAPPAGEPSPPPPPPPTAPSSTETGRDGQVHPAVLPDNQVPEAARHAAVLPESEHPRGSQGETGLSNIPPPPVTLDGELRQRWLEIVTKGKLIDNQNYFEMLGVSRGAKGDEAKTAYLRLAKVWHPDRLPAELAGLKPYAQMIFSHLSEAHNTLTDEKERIKYVQTVREGGGTPATDRMMQRILESALEYERVLVMTRKHQYPEALEALEQILKVVKDEPDYHAMYAWLLLQKNPQKAGTRAPYDDMLAAVDTALGLHAQHEKANLYKAQILRRMGRTRDALEYYRQVAKINPNNVEAAREVRIATMRGQSLGPSPHGKGKRKKPKEEPGLLGKLFKRR